MAASCLGPEDEFTYHQWSRWVQEESWCCDIRCAGDRQRFVVANESCMSSKERGKLGYSPFSKIFVCHTK